MNGMNFFDGQVGTPKSAATEWQQWLNVVYVMAGVADDHSYRLKIHLHGFAFKRCAAAHHVEAPPSHFDQVD
jgi:hypothetical protein